MATQKKTEWILEQKFDRASCRHYMNGGTSVLHCHHYATLFCQLASDAELFDGGKLLSSASELSFKETLSNYFEEHGYDALEDRIALAEEYWRVCGMGLVKFEKVGPMSAVARMDHSHIDEGWIKKWDKSDKPINFIGQGFVIAALEAAYGLPSGSYKAEEVQSIVCGAECSRFHLVRA